MYELCNLFPKIYTYGLNYYLSMKLQVNGKVLEVKDNITVAELLRSMDIQIRPVGLAVAVNEEVVPKSAYADYILKENDRVEIVNIVGGG